MKARRNFIVLATSLIVLLMNLSFAATNSAPQQRPVVVTVKIVDENTVAISGAHVAVFQGSATTVIGNEGESRPAHYPG